jgi:hypothetical protein
MCEDLLGACAGNHVVDRTPDAPVDGRRRERPLFEVGSVQLDVRAGRLEDGQSDVGGPLEERAQIVAVGVQRPAVVTGQERSRGQFGFIESIGAANESTVSDNRSTLVMMSFSSGNGRTSEPRLADLRHRRCERVCYRSALASSCECRHARPETRAGVPRQSRQDASPPHDRRPPAGREPPKFEALATLARGKQ